MATLNVRDGYVDQYNSLESLIKTNGGLFKSEAQLGLFRDRWGNALMGDPTKGPLEAPVPGQFVVTAKLRSDDRSDRASHELRYLCDETGVVAKFLVTVRHSTDPAGAGTTVKPRWTRS